LEVLSRVRIVGASLQRTHRRFSGDIPICNHNIEKAVGSALDELRKAARPQSYVDLRETARQRLEKKGCREM